MDYKVVLTSRALHDLFEIVSFVAQKHPPAAQKTGLALLETAESLAFLPYRGPPIKGQPGYRKLPHLPHYLVAYRINDSERLVEIVRFWDGRQNPGRVHMS
ncbi:MAG TPA: type II toxin-antitoxin system RelE/ParE family toxin [Lacunisphaera sp.]|nr:type II toxin-antitoxin system RelE/ParE family toxin [Lacunisphaera sp.]